MLKKNIMEKFYVTFTSESSGYYFPSHKISNFKTKLATKTELKPEKWDIGLVEIAYPKEYKKRFLHNTIL